MREFALAVGGAYIRETVQLRDARGWTIEGGLVLHGLNRQAGEVRTSGFWGSATDGLFVTSRLEPGANGLRLVGEGTDYPGGVATPVRSEIFWETPERLVWRTYLRPDGQAEYLDHVITYRVAAAPVIGAPG
jgi:hypothetical protein